MRENFDPTTIEDEDLRQFVLDLMNLVEQLHATVATQAQEIQRLRDEINRLKGEQGKPKILPNKPQSATLSSQKERAAAPQPHQKASKQATLHIDRVEELQVDPTQLPQDAQFKGYEEVVVQDIDFRTDNVLFRKEKYYSPCERKTYLASLPVGYHGQFGPGVRAWVLTLYFSGGMSEPKILELLQTVGMRISAGQLSDLLIADHESFHAESQAVLRAGLASTPWQHLDSTATRVNGQNQNCHVLCNPFYSAYWTTPAKDRLSLLRALQGGDDPLFRFDAFAMDLMKELGVGKKWQDKLVAHLPAGCQSNEQEINAILDEHVPSLGLILRKNIKDALAVAAYRTQTLWPVVELLIVDDAPQFNFLTAELALCWIHEFRHYKKLLPCIPYHRKILDDFGEAFWKLYRQLLLFQQAPCHQEASRLVLEFERIFTQKTGYQQLDDRLALTLAKRESLLMVLCHPEILLHNNPAELGARQRVRKRDVSLQARTKGGIHAWDTFQTLVATAKKLGVNIHHYLRDRVGRTNALPSLSSLIAERAKLSPLGASWDLPVPMGDLG